TARLEALGRGEGATLFMVLLAAFQALLAKYAGSDDVCVGTPIAGRTRAEVEGLIGFFVNTLVLRADLSGDPRFREVLRRVRQATLGAYDHQDVPFEKLVAELQPERSLSHSPLFQVVLSYQTADMVGGALPGVRMRFEDAGVETTKYDLVLTLARHPNGLRAGLTFNTDLFERATAGRMLEHLRRVLEQVAGDADPRVSEVSLLDDAERARVIEEWNRTGAEYPSLPVHRLIAEQAARTPEAAAVRWEMGSLSYRELEARANRLARHLRRLGVGLDSRVAISLERGPDLVVAVLAVLKAGAAYVPMDPGAPAERVALMLADSGAAVLLTQGDGPSSIPAGVAVVRVDADRDAIAAESDEPVDGGATAESLAYVIYTSGSTGTPKGVGVEHRGLSNYLAFFDREILGPDGFALPTVSRPSFDAHVRQLFPPLLRGQAVWVLPEETVADPRALLAALAGARGRVSFGGVPSLWSAVLALIESGEAVRPQGLVAVLLGGEALPDELAERTFALFPDVALWNHYGPTEATVNTSVARVRPGERVNI
ncbi:MAG TPA: AMP-binding protein, partial [Longimicrobiaceae bacterium]